jgi:hypothetical protein
LQVTLDSGPQLRNKLLFASRRHGL